MLSDAGSVTQDNLWMAIVSTVASVMGEPGELGPQTQLSDLGLDSLNLLHLVFLLEEQFDINLLEAVTKQPTSLGELHDLIADLRR